MNLRSNNQVKTLFLPSREEFLQIPLDPQQ
jgi:hypothetical protein